ncbi:hypothetical protein [Sphingomonas sp. Leaf17]|uniref:hypothetical protein n=1 Tax=Sphingomonas sp. Leaf17 TaxID=1735683 RepID=UPI000A7FE1E6|nr:hypothetical protein [Sphingomonas sp. Leaf17]
MRLLALALLVLPHGAVSAQSLRSAEKPGGSLCRTGPSVAASRRAAPVGMHKLGDLPPAAQIQTVWRQVDGCPTPVVLRDGIGANPGSGGPVSGDGQVLRVQ